MRVIKLNSIEWRVDENKSLGSGGFGQVFHGAGQDGTSVAIKRLNVTAPQVAHRELQVAVRLMERGLVHVLPFLDAGQDANSDEYFMVMPLAERDLQSEIDEKGASSEIHALAIMVEILDGLVEVDELVHRDLKPRNVLLHDGAWKIADFGLARFIEDSTSSNTVMHGMSAPYAAPEQWNLQRSSHATDIYALGCIGYALVTGRPPFEGPSKAEYKHQHLHEAPQKVQEISPGFRSLLSMMLRKSQDSRPDLVRVRSRLLELRSESTQTSQEGILALSLAGALYAERTAKEEAITQLQTTELNNRRDVAEQAFHILGDIFDQIIQRIGNSAPTAIIQSDRGFGGKAILGLAEISWGSWHQGRFIDEDAFRTSHWNVYAGAYIKVVQSSPRLLVGYGSSIWYAKMNEHASCRWYEVSYMTHPLMRDRKEYEPYELMNVEEANRATSPGMDVCQKAFGPVEIDDEDMNSFIDRWLSRFAAASEGRLQRPGKLPL